MEGQLDKKLITSHTFSGTFPTPGSPPCSEDYRGVGNPKGWYSERVPQSGHQARKGYVGVGALLPFSSGRAMPSKWDDAERWISSPVSVGNVSNSGNYFYGPGVHKGTHLAHNVQRRAKSKSGPLGPLGGYNAFSPVLGAGVINSGKLRNSLTIESRTDICGDGGGGEEEGEGRRRSFGEEGDREWLDLWSCPVSHGDKCDVNLANDDFENMNDDNNKDDNAYNNEAKVDRVISRRDMATQMYPESESSTLSANNSPCPLLNNDPNMNTKSPEFEVRDVQIDKQMSRRTQRPIPKENEAYENFSYSSTNKDGDNKMFKLQREEARINAWENLQKAKAESAIQKLEMKLEKKRATSMEKILEKLQRAEIKAQKMRGSLDDGRNHVQSRALLKTTSKFPSFCKKIRLSSSTRSCLTCYPF